MTQPSDAQSRAYREAGDADHWDDDVNTLIADHGAVYHEPITSLADIPSPDEYEAAAWDVGREPPKTLTEAQAALEQRIADPEAPDGPESAGAYDPDGGDH